MTPIRIGCATDSPYASPVNPSVCGYEDLAFRSRKYTQRLEAYAFVACASCANAKHSLQPFKTGFADLAPSFGRRKIDSEYHAGVGLRFRHSWPVFG